MEELARVERLKTLGKGKDTVFKISYQDKVTLFIELVKVVEGWLRLNSLDKETAVRPLGIFSNPFFNGIGGLMFRYENVCSGDENMAAGGKDGSCVSVT